MKTKVSPTVIGLFVIGFLALALTALFSFGNVNFFSKPERFVVYFNESIHGLDNGSPVKLRGVRIGRVVSMKIRATPAEPGAVNPRSVVAVLCELNRDVMADAQGNPVDVSSRDELQKLVDDGLRAQLGVIGYATGLLYIELDFYDPKAFPGELSSALTSDHLTIPTLPSKSAEFLRSLDQVLAQVKQVDFVAIAKNLDLLLIDTRRQINAADLAAISREWSGAARSIRELAESPETRLLITNASTAAVRLNTVLADLEKHVGPSAEQLNAVLGDARTALTDFSETATVMKRFVNAQQNLGDDATQALTRVGEAAAAIARLADFLERNPNALISGRRPPEKP